MRKAARHFTERTELTREYRINGIALALGIISAVFILFSALSAKGVGGYFVLAALGILLVSFVSWAIVKVMLNISNNLHMINSKLK